MPGGLFLPPPSRNPENWCLAKIHRVAGVFSPAFAQLAHCQTARLLAKSIQDTSFPNFVTSDPAKPHQTPPGPAGAAPPASYTFKMYFSALP